MQDEPFRIMSGFYDRDFTGYGVEYTDEDKIHALRLTLQHVQKCSPSVLEIPESLDLIQMRFPRLPGAFSTEYAENVNEYSKYCKLATLSPEQLQLFSNYTAWERLLYHVVFKKVAQRLQQSNITAIKAAIIHRPKQSESPLPPATAQKASKLSKVVLPVDSKKRLVEQQVVDEGRKMPFKDETPRPGIPSDEIIPFLQLSHSAYLQARKAHKAPAKVNRGVHQKRRRDG
jgi:hypothetical protein